MFRGAGEDNGSFTYENTRLLLLSKSKADPNGLSNNHGQVGKHYFGDWMSCGNGAVLVLFPFDLNVRCGRSAQDMVVDEWAADNYRSRRPRLHRRFKPPRVQ